MRSKRKRIKIGTMVATSRDAQCYAINAWTGWPSVIKLPPGDIVSLIYNFSHMAQHITLPADWSIGCSLLVIETLNKRETNYRISR